MIRSLQQPSLLWVHALGLSGRNGEEFGIKCTKIFSVEMTLIRNLLKDFISTVSMGLLAHLWFETYKNISIETFVWYF